MNLRNRVQLIGNLGNTPVVKVFKSGNKMARFSIATSDIYKKNDEYIKDTQWHNIIVWGKNADIAERSLTTGCEVVIEGRLVQRSYIDKIGNKQSITEVVANSLIFRNYPSIKSTEVKSNKKIA